MIVSAIDSAGERHNFPDTPSLIAWVMHGNHRPGVMRVVSLFSTGTEADLPSPGAAPSPVSVPVVLS